ncbi:MAG: hypothetical protein GX075_09395 [Firmicutes bacterium]|nr:hypothetical protein [Bacillota bacterium]
MVHKARKTVSKPAKNPALEIAEYYRKKSEVFTGSDLTVGILGHPYCIYDFCLNLNTLERLTGNVRFVTPEMMPDQFKGAGAGRLPKSLFWTMGRLQFDAVEWMLTLKKVDGFIQLVTFACGPEAIVGDLLERKIKEAGKPFLRLYFEEHSGEAGIITRLEAFLDLLKYRSRAC